MTYALDVNVDTSIDADHETLCSALMESMIHLQAASQSFRDLFRSQSVTQAFVTAFKSYYVALKSAELRPGLLSILDKLKHFGLTLALDNAVSGTHKREVRSQVSVVIALHADHALRSWTSFNLLRRSLTGASLVASALTQLSSLIVGH